MKRKLTHLLTLLCVGLPLFYFSATTARTATQATPKSRPPRTLGDFDIRAELQRSLTEPPALETKNSAQRLAHRAAPGESRLLREHAQTQLRWSSLTGAPSRVFNLAEPLTAASNDDAEFSARRFLKQNSALFLLRAAEVDGLQIARRQQSAHNGVTHLTLQQHINDLEVFQGEFTTHLDRDGAVIAANGELLPDAASTVNLTQPRLSALEALRLAATHADAKISGEIRQAKAAATIEQQQWLSGDASFPFSREAEARLVYFPLQAGQTRLAWEFNLWLRETPDVYLLLIDAERGSLLYRYNLTWYDENPLRPHGLVFTKDSPRPDAPHTSNAPATVAREDVPFQAAPFNGAALFPVSDPHYDWWAGAAATGLISNNVDAHLDRDNNNSADTPRLNTANGNFSFPLNLTQAPTTAENQQAAQVNLFYWVNRYHDILYALGFTEAAGNFQTNNFGRGGLGNDALQADAQDGSGVNNANYSTSRDGGQSRIQMYLWTTASPQLDGDLDQGIIIHELTHGLSTRLVGNGTGLTDIHGRGMGEGWSDYFGLALLRNEGDDLDGAYAVGQYALNNYTKGIRRYPYSTSLQVSPLTFKDIALNTEAHGVGEIWGEILWEMRAALIRRLGFREGQRQSLQLVVDGLKLTPVGPSFVDARNAIMLADRQNNGGANQCVMWQAFAKRGMGFSASAFNAGDAKPVEAFDLPAFCNNAGSVQLDKRAYLAGETLKISVADGNAAAPVRVRVTSSVTGDQETIALASDATYANIFTANLRLAAGQANANDGVLQVSLLLRDKLVVAYDDANTGAGAAAQVTAQADIAGEKTIFEDTVENGNRGWFASGAWAISSLKAASPTRSWTDTPSGNYANDSDTTITSPLFNLAQAVGVVLTFAHSYDLESGFDYGLIEYSLDDGATWQRGAAFTGVQSSFTQARVTLDALAGQARARIRFRLLTDAGVVADGWHIDDLRVIARTSDPALLPPVSARAPMLAAANPAFINTGATAVITLLGANFTESSDTRVLFNGAAASEVNVLSGATLTVRTPGTLTAGPITLQVENRNGAATLANAFYIYAQSANSEKPTLSSIAPASGSTRGGTVVMLSGAKFTPGAKVFFGAQAAPTVSFLNASTLSAVTPAGATSAVDVSVNNPTSEKATLAGAFTYGAPSPPTVSLLMPKGGERFYLNSTVTVRWQSADNRALAKHRVALYRSSGATLPALQLVADLAAELPGAAQSFNWAIPANLAPSTLYRIRVVAVDDESAEGEAYSSGDFAIERRWETVQALPAGVQRSAVTTDGRYVYSFGGRSTTNSSNTTANAYRFDPTATPAVWTSLPTMPTGLNGGDAIYLNGKIYLPGGIDATISFNPTHLVYDAATSSWVTKAANPGEAFLYALAADPVRGVYYLTGGVTAAQNAPVTTVRVYDPASNTWSTLPPMKTARFAHEAALINGKLYVVGGSGSAGGLADGEVYDFETRQWTAIANLNRPRRYAINGVTNDAQNRLLWLVAGGENPADGVALTSAEAYDVARNRWFPLDSSFNVPTVRTALGGAVLNGALYAIGGGALSSGTGSTFPTVERLRLNGIETTSANQPPLLLVPGPQVAMAGSDLTFLVTAHDLGSDIPLTLRVEGLTGDHELTNRLDSNNSVTGVFRFRPASADVGRSLTANFSASDGQLSEVKSVVIRVTAAASTLLAVNAADFRSGPLAADSMAAIFGANLATRIEAAQTQPLPTTLAGTTVMVNGLPAPLFFVSPTQLNFALPAALTPGAATIVVTNQSGGMAFGSVEIAPAAPAIFTANATGQGDAAALATTDGVTFRPPPFEVQVNGQPNVLVLYGTGLRRAPAANPNDGNGVAEAVSLTIDGQTARVLYAGAQGNFTGLDQINVELPGVLAAQGLRRVSVVATVNGVAANRVTIQIR